jgi:hypothetical protein
MFLNRKLIVQLSTSRFRPQPKETNPPISQVPQQLMIMNTPSPSSYHHSTGGSKAQQQSTSLTPQYTYSDLNYDMMTSTNLRPQSSSPPIPENQNYFRPPSPLSQDMTNYYSTYSNLPIDRMTPSATKMNHMKLNKNIKAGKFSRMD